MTEHVFEKLPAYLLGCLGEGEVSTVTAHLEECSSCRAALRTYYYSLEALPVKLALSEPPSGIKNEILQRARRESPIRGPAGVGMARPGGHGWGALGWSLVAMMGVGQFLLWRRLNTLTGEKS